MSTHQTSLVVQASPERTFDVFSDLSRAADRVRGIQRIELMGDGRVGVGTRFRETRVVFKKETTEEMEITAFERPRRYVVEADSCGARFVSEFRFVPEGDGTRVEVEFEATPVTFFAKLLSPLSGLMAGACMKQFRGDMEDLAAVAEDRADPTGAPAPATT